MARKTAAQRRAIAKEVRERIELVVEELRLGETTAKIAERLQEVYPNYTAAQDHSHIKAGRRVFHAVLRQAMPVSRRDYGAEFYEIARRSRLEENPRAAIAALKEAQRTDSEVESADYTTSEFLASVLLELDRRALELTDEDVQRLVDTAKSIELARGRAHMTRTRGGVETIEDLVREMIDNG